MFCLLRDFFICTIIGSKQVIDKKRREISRQVWDQSRIQPGYEHVDSIFSNR